MRLDQAGHVPPDSVRTSVPDAGLLNSLHFSV